MARLKLKPPSSDQTECQKAFVRKLTIRLQKAYLNGLDMQCELSANRVERLSKKIKPYKKDWNVFICFWILYIIFLWLL
jgi:hypothetical protein